MTPVWVRVRYTRFLRMRGSCEGVDDLSVCVLVTRLFPRAGGSVADWLTMLDDVAACAGCIVAAWVFLVVTAGLLAYFYSIRGGRGGGV